MARSGRDLMLLSIRPHHAADILDGLKTVEFRRAKPVIEPGQAVLLYASSPVCAVVGACRIESFEIGAAASIRAKHLTDAAISRSAFDHYFEGARQAVALHLAGAVTIQDPIPLTRLRRSRATTPVQSWRFMSRDSLGPLLAEADRATLDNLVRAKVSPGK